MSQRLLLNEVSEQTKIEKKRKACYGTASS